VTAISEDCGDSETNNAVAGFPTTASAV